MNSATKLTGRVIYKGDPGYEAARKNWDPHTDRFPKVFVFAQKTQDVANAIKWANEHRIPIRPRGGRHALEVNLSQVNGGIVIDVSEMNSIKLNKKRGQPSSEPETQWGESPIRLPGRGIWRLRGQSYRGNRRHYTGRRHRPASAYPWARQR